MKQSIFYFAYGSNLDERQMARRCPTSLVAGPATLAGHRLAFTGHSRTWGGAVATVVPDVAANVRGLLYRCSADDIECLDCFEGHPTSYRREVLPVASDEGQVIDAVVYLKPSNGNAAGDPSRDYLQLIRDAYDRLGFDVTALPGQP